MERITCGSASADLVAGSDGILRVSVRGWMSTRNAGPLGARVLQAGAGCGAIGVVVALDGALVALPPVDAAHYRHVPPHLRDLPVAVLISPAQAPFFAAITPAAARCGTMRRAFLSRAEAEAWLREQARSLSANRAWWSLRR